MHADILRALYHPSIQPKSVVLQWFSKCVPWFSRGSINWKFERNANPTPTHWTRDCIVPTIYVLPSYPGNSEAHSCWRTTAIWEAALPDFHFNSPVDSLMLPTTHKPHCPVPTWQHIPDRQPTLCSLLLLAELIQVSVWFIPNPVVTSCACYYNYVIKYDINQ